MAGSSPAAGTRPLLGMPPFTVTAKLLCFVHSNNTVLFKLPRTAMVASLGCFDLERLIKALL